jgi:hypothetical protein
VLHYIKKIKMGVKNPVQSTRFFSYIHTRKHRRTTLTHSTTHNLNLLAGVPSNTISHVLLPSSTTVAPRQPR